jgi:small subunit ribosomal protein S4
LYLRALARQVVSHGHITVNGKKMTIPSYQVEKGDVIAIREGSKKQYLFTDIATNLKHLKLQIGLNGTMIFQKQTSQLCQKN